MTRQFVKNPRFLPQFMIKLQNLLKNLPYKRFIVAKIHHSSMKNPKCETIENNGKWPQPLKPQNKTSKTAILL